MTTIIIVIAAIKSWNEESHWIICLGLGHPEKYIETSDPNDVLKFYDEIKYPDLIAVRKKLEKWGDTSTMVDNESLLD